MKLFIKNDVNMCVVMFFLSWVLGFLGSGVSEFGFVIFFRLGEVEDRNEEERVVVEKVMLVLLFLEDFVWFIVVWFDGSGVLWFVWLM